MGIQLSFLSAPPRPCQSRRPRFIKQFSASGGTVFEHQAAFTEAVRSSRGMRKRIFDTLEQRHAHDFGNGKLGMTLYDTLLSAVRDSGVPEAAQDFENRFFPLLYPKRRGGGWGWTSAPCVAAIILIALILGFNALKTTPVVELPTVAEVPIPAAKVTELASETMTEQAPAIAAEQEPSSEH
jgi:hypothetical protein